MLIATHNASAVFGRRVAKCEGLLGLSLNIAITSCINDGCENGGFCLAYTKGVYSFTACRCIAGILYLCHYCEWQKTDSL